MNPKLRHIPWALAVAAIPTYALSYWFTSQALLRAAFSEGVGYNIERAEWAASRILALSTGILLVLSIVLGIRAAGKRIYKAWWCIPVVAALALLVWWDFLGIGFK